VSEPATAYRGTTTVDPFDRSAQGAPVTAVARVDHSGFFEQQPFEQGAPDGRVMSLTDKTAYALRIKGDDLAPAIESGQYLIVLPGAEPQPGERIVVSFKDGRKAVLKLLFRRADTIAVTELAGGLQQTLERDELEYVHAVFGLVEASQWWRAVP
jgi:phage repressor protein C with HTH and peptisase S24 domain